ncbi:hypothetical protein ACVPOQ_01475 [Staphylococcus aureus]
MLLAPPGLGKTKHLSNIIANEMEVNIRTVSGPSLEDLVIWLQYSNWQVEMFYTDEIHRLSGV